ncbi:PREDICTED: F-box/kelch-repeat protein At4g25710-like [Camelina sativa]|uniref:F-box/kelch-repeat protein At4g25710-like n=1 Tax=Camelina sativa TaxID=90675 RepID=A0ABM0V5Q8_CAMSA|nr:PREDICTED: F-box/kelch-repeat protein At4g25710-like [Camelina sativa]
MDHNLVLVSNPGSNRKKRKTTTTTPQSTPNPSLPDDLLLLIIARVPILYYPILSLVSKSFRSLLSSPGLYKIRSLLGRMESRLYVCMDILPPGKGPAWFTLCRKPDRTLSDKEEEMKSSGYALARVPFPHSPLVTNGNLVAVGSDIYNLGTPSNGKASSSSVWILDCTSHTWREAPSLPVELSSTVTASVLDQKIYVAGWYKADDAPADYSMKNSFTVLDTTKTQQACDLVPIHCSLAQGKLITLSTCIGGKVYVGNWGIMVGYNPVEGCWENVGQAMSQYLLSDCYCEIDDVLYSLASDRVLRWYDPQVRTWSNVMGLVGLPKLPPDDPFVKMANYGGKLVVLWNRPHVSTDMLWCAEIALERRNTCEIWGKVEWYDPMVEVPTLVSINKALSATL